MPEKAPPETPPDAPSPVSPAVTPVIASGALLTTQISEPWHMILTWGVIVGLGTGSMTQMLAATVEMASRRGSRVLVIASPIPWQHLEGEGLFEAGRYARRMDALRRAVEASGGRFLDLHRALRKADFRDHLGHYSEQGTQILAAKLQPVVEKLLFAPESSR